MIGENPIQTDVTLKADFTKAATTKRKSGKRPTPVSLRLSAEEREQLQQDAGGMALSSYIRKRLFGDKVKPRSSYYTKRRKAPRIDAQAVAQLLGMLGQSELATSMLALSIAAQSGSLPVTPELEEKLDLACDDIHAMRCALIMALKIKPEESR